jgi:hypothetical protein
MATGKQTAITAAVVAGAVGIADVGRVLIHDANEAKPLTRLHKPPPYIPPTTLGLGPIAQRLAHEIDNDEDLRAATCLAISYLDGPGLNTSSPGEFEQWIVDEVNTTPPHRSQEAFDKVRKLSQGDVKQLAGLYCDAKDAQQ